MPEAVTNFDFNILNTLQAHRTGWTDSLMTGITKLGDAGLIWLVLTAVLLLVPKTRRTGMACAAAIVIQAVICLVILKPLIARPRPFAVNPSAVLLIRPPAGYSFPSGHSAISFSVTGALAGRRSRLFVPALILAALIAFSRMYLYVHYPSDVLAGALIGLFCGLPSAHLVKRKL